ncbi:hypothetical protein [Oceanomicrobium pacificus]|uniref:Lipoprotein n=1 Tax=Oceanomicrobium pacificus TaxID=2692916 RepID=A0A6B0TX88_9RHOB|nr:hypothetical protein [Oceanomicrobium pacificus]MXU65902.1 hypothetical protein [Oceanomicrobium pacificus]
MFRVTMPLLGATLLAAACTTAPPPPPMDQTPFARITTEDAFRANMVGKTLTYGSGRVTLNADGTITGSVDGKPFGGTWEFRDGLLCRQLTALSGLRASDCEVWEIWEYRYRVTEQSGRGASTIYNVL